MYATPVFDSSQDRSSDNYFDIVAGMTQYLPKWLRNGFKTANDEPVKNYDLLIHLLALMNRMGTSRIRMKHVKGHAGHFGNEQADVS